MPRHQPQHAPPPMSALAPPCAPAAPPRARRVRCASLRRCASAGPGSLSAFEDFVLSAQSALCDDVARLDGGGQRFGLDAWERDGDAAGYGRTRVLSGGALLEKAAANISVVRGTLSAARASAMSARGRPGVDPAGGQRYSAVALSLVFHALSPRVPTLRGDVRAFAVEGAGAWIGGGADLTPSYVVDEDATAFHAAYAAVCDAHQRPGAPRRALYAATKAACDAYFYIPARGEHRGVGGIFFDDLPADDDASTAPASASPESVAWPVDASAFAQAVAGAWLPAWAPICERRRGESYGERERTWQLQRRGRYLEFNLLYDRGVRFGLDGGRIESIMVSAPPLIRWDYDVQPQQGSPEAHTLAVLRAKPRDWVAVA
jgi:coproporphyrinogen III oxidase